MQVKEDIFEGGRFLPLMEEFYTIQGEGYNTGKAAYFVRIGGCDVGCAWCDTKPSWNKDSFPPASTDEVVKRVVDTPAKTIVVTGGEPSMYDLEYLTTSLKKQGVCTMIETSRCLSINRRMGLDLSFSQKTISSSFQYL